MYPLVNYKHLSVENKLHYLILLLILNNLHIFLGLRLFFLVSQIDG